MATITAYYRDVDNLGILPSKATPQHSFFVYTNDFGQSFVLRGGQYMDGVGKGNLLSTNILSKESLAVVYDKFEMKSDGTKPMDWFSDHAPVKSSTYYTGSDIITSRLWNSMVLEGQKINNNPTLYKIFTDNCHTVLNTLGEVGRAEYAKIILEAAANGQSVPAGTFYGVSVPLDEDGDRYWAPGIGRDLNDISSESSSSYKLEFNLKGEKIIAYEGDKSLQLANSNLIASDATYVDENGNPVSLYDSLFVSKDSEIGTFTIVKNNIYIPLKDGVLVAVNKIIDAIDSTTSTLITFINTQIQDIFDPIFEKLFSTNDSTKDANGDNAAQRLAGKILADLIQGKDITEIAQDQVNSVLIQNLLKDASIKLSAAIPTGPLGADTAKFIQGTVAGAVINFAIAIAADHRMDSDEYGTAAAKALTSASLYEHFGGGAQGVAGVAAVISIYDSFKADSSMNSGQYEDTAISAAAAASSAYAGHMIGTYLAGIFSAAGPIGTVAGYAIGYVIGYLLYNPTKNNLDSKFDGTKEIYDALEDLILKGEITSGEGLEENFKQILRGIDDFIISSSGRAFRDFGIGAYNLFGGHYGQTFKPGQYPTPYSSISVTPKPGGTGTIIQGLNPQGVVAIAREYYHDDIYGTSGSDNLIGKSGTNTILGYEGNDHIEGRGDIDLLIGGSGDDEIFGGNGDDQIYGSEGSDNLFGGNGDDIIIGGTGASIGSSGSLVDGNDFIQAGNGNDQIMAEAGNDQIQGNSGNDTILGGTGNDRIEGNDGDDSILGEDGDDSIIAGSGSDIIDGGSGTDIIFGNAGNDNIRGGDGNDEISGDEGVDIIYGDAGNDLINSGSENDLAFGGLGNDIIFGADGDDSLSGEFGSDYVIGGDGSDIIDGGEGDDVLFGGLGNDTITNDGGNDTIIFRLGDGQDTISEAVVGSEAESSNNDVLKLFEINSKLSDNATNKAVLSKSGNDLIIQFKSDLGTLLSDKITVSNQFDGAAKLKKIEFADSKSIDLTSVTVNPDGTISYSTASYSNIDTSIQEELALGYADIMQSQGDQQNPASSFDANNYNSSAEQEAIDYEKYNEMQWRSMKKKRSVFGGHYTVWYQHYEGNVGGTNGNDRLVGHWWSENIYGGSGNDQLHGGDGNDNLFGGSGNDILHGGAGNDQAYGEAGLDLIYGGAGNDYLDGGADNDSIYGNSGADVIIGGLGDDNLEGNEGDDSINDAAGNNIIIAGIGADAINTSSGNDKIEGNDGDDIINSGAGNDLIYGNTGFDVINAGEGNDTIYGQEDGDIINAGSGDDYVSGGLGNDILNGEDGNDTIYGDLGIDQISGGAGIDYIYGGAGADIISGDAGNDTIKGGDSDDFLDGGADNDTIYGESGSDKIFGQSGNDLISGGLGGDVLEGGAGDDAISGGAGNDILVDGAGSDVLDAGNDSDIIILTKETSASGDFIASGSIDRIRNFNKNEDKIILKVNYHAPISFASIQAAMTQNGANVEVSLDNGQKIIIENLTTADITSTNFQIGLSGGANNDILFGTDGEDVIFGDEGDDKIYGGEGNDELWGGAGSDELYGEGGDDILRFEADGRYDPNISSNTYSVGNSPWNPTLGTSTTTNFGASDDVLTYDVSTTTQISGTYWPGVVIAAFMVLNTYRQTTSTLYYSRNFLNAQLLEIDGYNRTFDKFLGGDGVNTILMTEGNDVLALDDPTSASGSNVAGTSSTGRVKDISVIHAGAGDDVINFSTSKYSYSDLIVYGGTGNDHLWTSSGNDQIFGGNGNDEIYSGAGDDNLVGGLGDDVIYGGANNDSLEGGAGANQLFGESGDDIFIAGSGADLISGGEGSDTISYANSTSNVSVNLVTNSLAGGGAGNDASNDAISSIENISGSSFNDNLVGNTSANIFNGNNGNDLIAGGTGSDTYIYNQNSGIDTITESSPSISPSDIDTIEFGSGITATDLTFAINGNDLEIQVGVDSTNKIILKNQVSGSAKIEFLKFGSSSGMMAFASSTAESRIAISEKFFITNEDQQLIFANPLDEVLAQRRRFESINASSGSIIFNELTNQFTYQPSTNFHGIDEITLTEEGGQISKFSLFVNGINDAPIGDIPNREVKVEEEFSVNLRDYFSDVDGDELSLSLSLSGFNDLPNWINFNQESGILSGKSGRDGILNFSVTATDTHGLSVLDNFRIKITRDIADDIIPNVEVVQLLGTDSADILQAVANSSDIIMAGAGDDVIEYGQDQIWQPAGDFIYKAWNVYSNDEISVTGKVRSFDAFDGGDGYDKLNLTTQNDVMFLDDVIVSNIGDIAKISSIEEINAGAGDDVIDLTSLSFSYGDIVINGEDGDDVLWSNSGNDQISGGNGNDNIQSGTGDDQISGGDGDDVIKAFDGNDQITGNKGSDTLIGGAGNDQFIFTNLDDSTNSESDFILDFLRGSDKINLASFDFDSITKGKDSATSANGLEFYFDSANNTIIDDPNSNFAIKLAGEINLSGGDFVF